MKKMQLPIGENKWHILCSIHEVGKRPSKHTLFDHDFTAYRTSSCIVVLEDLCPHRGAPLSAGKVVGNAIECAYHGWNIGKDGKVAKIAGMHSKPCAKALAGSKFSSSDIRKIKASTYSFHLTESADYVWINFAEEVFERPAHTRYHDSFSHYESVKTIKARQIEIWENFLDPMHTFFIHKGILRSSKGNSAKKINIKLSTIEKGYLASYTEKPTGLTGKIFGRYIQDEYGRFLSPGFIELEYKSQKGIEMLITIMLSQVSERTCRVYFRTHYPTKGSFIWLKKLVLNPIQNVILRQDVNMLELQEKNLAKFEGFQPRSTKLDQMREPIENVLSGTIKPLSKEITLENLD